MNNVDLVIGLSESPIYEGYIGYSRTLILHELIIIWLVVSTPLKKMKVNWDDDSHYMEKYNMFQNTNQIIKTSLNIFEHL